jgi:hypothetical protein
MNIITTADELDALPVGSVVMEGDNGCPVPWVGGICVMPGVWHRFPDGWYVVAGHGSRVPEFDLGPLTILYRPDQPHTVRPGVDELRSAIFHSTYPNMRWADLTDEEASDFDKATDAIVALLPGRSEAVVKAEALREVADILGHATYSVKILAMAVQVLYAAGFRGLGAELADVALEYAAMRDTLKAVRKASRLHPDTCDRHDEDDPIACGWKRAVVDMRRALEGAAK